MNVQVKTAGGITLMSMDTRLMGDREIFLEGEINESMACDFARKVNCLLKADRDGEIKVFINSAGGEINSGLLIYDIIQSCGKKMKLYCTGKAYSMAGILLASGEKGCRFVLPHSEIMLHEPLLGNRVSGSSSSIKSISDTLIQTKRMLNELLARHTGKTPEEIEEITGYDHYFSAKESMDFGLCDGIMDFQKMIG